MVSRERVLLIVAADRRELAGVARRLSPPRLVDSDLEWSKAGMLGVKPVVLAANGMGRANAACAVESACMSFQVAAVVSTGLCGALDPALSPGRVLLADRVISLEPRTDFAARSPQGAGTVAAFSGALLTVDRVVQTVEEKRRLRATGAVAVDMEAAGVAREAQKRNLPFFCVRVISDTAEQSFCMDYNRARRADGRLSPVRLLWQAGLNPSRWQELMAWWRTIRAGSEMLGDVIEHLEFDSGSQA